MRVYTIVYFRESKIDILRLVQTYSTGHWGRGQN